ncbi:MAG TPA: NAD-dependent deacylase [Phycisphaerae bacterium]|nr:NAD-dependent deacylase [Phycisphaerae bacterium]
MVRQGELVDEQLLDQAADRLRRAEHVCVLTGAGVSAESGVPTFRGAHGLWKGFRAEQLATPEAFASDPPLVWKFYNWRRELLADVRPNPGHTALARMETILPRFDLITQNVDGLHQAAGSRNVIELHGNLWHVRCVACSYQRQVVGEKLPAEPRCPHCGDWLRPGVVWFGELLPTDALDAARRATDACDVMLVVGTSAVVQPAALMADWARQHGAAVIEINPEATPLSSRATICLPGASGQVLPRLLDRLQPRADSPGTG